MPSEVTNITYYIKMTFKLFFAFHFIVIVLSSDEPEVIIIPGNSKEIQNDSSDSSSKVLIIDDNVKSKSKGENTIIVVGDRNPPPPPPPPQQSAMPKPRYYHPFPSYISPGASMYPPRTNYATGYLAGASPQSISSLTHSQMSPPPPPPPPPSMAQYLSNEIRNAIDLRYQYAPPMNNHIDRIYNDNDEDYNNNGQKNNDDDEDEKDNSQKYEEGETARETKYPTAAVMEEKVKSHEEEKKPPCDLNAIKELFMMNMILMMKMNARHIDKQIEERMSSKGCHTCKHDEVYDSNDKNSIIYDSMDASNKLTFTNSKLPHTFALGKMLMPSLMTSSLPESNEISLSPLTNEGNTFAFVPPVTEPSSSPLMRSLIAKLLNQTNEKLHSKTIYPSFTNEPSTITPQELMKILKLKAAAIASLNSPSPTTSSFSSSSSTTIVPNQMSSQSENEKVNSSFNFSLPPHLLKNFLTKSLRTNSTNNLTTKSPSITVQSYWSTGSESKDDNLDMIKSPSELYSDALKVELLAQSSMSDSSVIEDPSLDTSVDTSLLLDDSTPFTLD